MIDVLVWLAVLAVPFAYRVMARVRAARAVIRQTEEEFR